MPIRLTSGYGAANSFAKRVSSSSHHAVEQQVTKMIASRRLLTNTCQPPPARVSTISNRLTPYTSAINKQAIQIYQRRFQSTWRNNNNNSQNNKKKNNIFSTLSTLGTLVGAGTGTFASTLLALYLATIVETSAHEFLYEYFPHWYFEIQYEELPNCLKQRELARRSTGLIECNRAKGVEEGGNGYLMGIDGWMEQEQEISEKREGTILDVELLAEKEFETRQEARGISLSVEKNEEQQQVHTLSPWQRKMTEKRAGIIAGEERDFKRGIDTSTDSSDKQGNNKTNAQKAKLIQEEASRKLQERLMSVAMTA